MDQLICASLSYTHYWYEMGMLKVLSHDGSLFLLPSSRTFAGNSRQRKHVSFVLYSPGFMTWLCFLCLVVTININRTFLEFNGKALEGIESRSAAAATKISNSNT